MEDFLARTWADLVGREHGLFHFRLVVQPLMAAVFATRGGLKDAREGRPPFFWAALTDRVHRQELLREGWKDVGKVFVAAIVVDIVYQAIVLRRFHPSETLIVAVALAILPYLILRGPLNRMARRWHPGAGASR